MAAIKHVENINISKYNTGFPWITFLRQTLISSGVWTCYFTMGLYIGSTTVLIPQLRREANSTEVVSSEMASWLPAIYTYAGLPWIFILPLLLKTSGRKKSQLFVSVTTLGGFIIFYCSSSLAHIIASELIHSINFASHLLVAVMVITEYTSPKYRGFFLTIKSATFFWGMWVSNALGTFFHWKTIPLLGIVSSIYGVVIMIFWPESPYWLASKGRFEECSASHRWLMGTDENSERELEKMIGFHRENIRNNARSKIISRNYFKNVFQIMSKKQFYKPILFSALVVSLYAFSGKLICSIYAIEILSKITNSESTSYTVMLIIDGVTTFSMYIGSGISRFLKRRTLLIGSSSIAVLMLFTISLYLYLIKLELVLENKYVAIALLTTFSVAISCGPMILCSSISGELISIESRSMSACVMALVFQVLHGILVKLSPYIFETCGVHGTFLFYGISSSILLTLIYKYLPETKDKSLQEIAECMKGFDSHESKEADRLMSHTVNLRFNSSSRLN